MSNSPRFAWQSQKYGAETVRLADQVESIAEMLSTKTSMDTNEAELRSSAAMLESAARLLAEAGQKAALLAGEVRGYAEGVAQFNAPSSGDES